MIIDSHVHLKHGNVDRTEYRPRTIVEVMDDAGIDKSVVFAMCTTTRRSIEMAREAAELYPERLLPYVYALPSYERPVLREIETALSDYGFHGVKIHAGECTLGEYVVDPVVELAGSLGVPCLIDCTGRDREITRLAKSYLQASLIIAHLGRYRCTDRELIEGFIGIAERHPNVYLDVSGVVLPYMIVEAVHRIGADRVIFGTDGPENAPDLSGHARSEIAKIRSLDLTDEEQDAVLGGAITGLLGLPA